MSTRLTRKRKSTIAIAGQNVAVEAPGLKQIRRAKGVQLYWVKDEHERFGDYRPNTVAIHVDLDDTAAAENIEAICGREQTAMLLWLEDRMSDQERLAPKFNGTIGSLVDLYESDTESSFLDVRDNTQQSYRDTLKILRATIGARRLDCIKPKYFRTCYREWKKPAEEGGPERVRRAYGCIQLIKIILAYGVESDLAHCERLQKGIARMRFAKNPPREETMSYGQAKAIVTETLLANDPSTGLTQGLQYECFLRQIDILGRYRREPEDYVLQHGEIRRGSKVWRGMTIGMIDTGGVLRVRTSKTAQYVAHAIDKCELVMMCLDKVDRSDPNRPVAARRDGSPWPDRQSFAKHWRRYANRAGIPPSVRNMDNRASGITEATSAGVSHDDLSNTGGHASKATTRKVYMRGAKEISERVQSARQTSRRKVEEEQI